MNPRRLNRINSALQKELSLIIFEELPADKNFLTITGVEIAPDLKTAKVYIQGLDNDKVPLKQLDERKRYFQALLARRLPLKFTPVLEFILDNSGQNVDKILDIFKK